MAKKQRTDAERRVNQCERLGRLLRTLQLITGKGRWDAEGLAEELECSRRTVYRLLQTLSMAGVPWYFDDSCRAYRVRPGFKFPGIESRDEGSSVSKGKRIVSETTLRKLIQDGEAFLQSLREILDAFQLELPRENLSE